MLGQEYNATILSNTNNLSYASPVELLQNRPNPFDELTLIPIIINDPQFVKNAQLEIYTDSGLSIIFIKLDLKTGLNEILYDYQGNNYNSGNYFYSLRITGKIISTKKMILGNF